MKTGKVVQFAALSILVALATGCASQKTWVYSANAYASPPLKTDKKIVVLPFDDGRTNENHNLSLIAMIPLIPVGPMNYGSPEGVSMHMNSGSWVNFKPTEDFPKALAEDLRNTGMFSDAFFDYRRESGDYAVRGKILNTQYKGTMITYCLGPYGVYLWFIGFPCGWTENELSVDLKLVNAKTDTSLFEKIYTAAPRSDTSWIYVIKNDFNYAEMLAEVNKQFCADIVSVVQKAESESSSKPSSQPTVGK